MLNIWKKSLNKLSGTLTTNEYMPAKFKDLLLEEDSSLKNKLQLKELKFPSLNGILGDIKGLNILAGLQKLEKKDCLTVFRAVRFPTYKRMFQMVSSKGFAILNYEQERILDLYKNEKYAKKRNEIQQDKNFWVQPQERVVNGLPVFYLINDAIQIHYSFRNKIDKMVIVAIYIPQKLLKEEKIKLIANSAIDLNFGNNERDIEIKDFILSEGKTRINQKSLQARGVDLQEMYTKDLPWNIQDCEKIGIKQDFFLLDIYEIKEKEKIKKLFQDTKTLVKNRYFLHGFFGDQNIFGRRPSRYLPSACYSIEKK
ncbi:MAG: hypothetical protein ACFFDN_31695 [Candidatus Hodarchaeota archaeon]